MNLPSDIAKLEARILDRRRKLGYPDGMNVPGLEERIARELAVEDRRRQEWLERPIPQMRVRL